MIYMVLYFKFYCSVNYIVLALPSSVHSRMSENIWKEMNDPEFAFALPAKQ